MNELAAMQTFMRVAATGSFSKAAQQMGIAQGTASRRISDLEAVLGVILLRRTTRALTLTDVGVRYFDACTRAVSAMEDARQIALGERIERGSIRMAVPLSYATAWLAPRLPDFLARWPQIDLQLRASNERVDLVSEGIDLALRIGQARIQDAYARVLGQTRRCAVAAPSYLLDRAPPTFETLHDHQILTYGLADTGAAWDGWVDGRQQRMTPTSRVSADSGDVLRHIALGGGGIALLPDWMVAADLAAGRLVQVMQAVQFSPSPIRALWLGQPRPAGRLRAVIDWLIEVHDAR